MLEDGTEFMAVLKKWLIASESLIAAQRELEAAQKKQGEILDELEDALKKLASCPMGSRFLIPIDRLFSSAIEDRTRDRDRILNGMRNDANPEERKESLIRLHEAQRKLDREAAYWNVDPSSLSSVHNTRYSALQKLEEVAGELNVAQENLEKAEVQKQQAEEELEAVLKNRGEQTKIDQEEQKALEAKLQAVEIQLMEVQKMSIATKLEQKRRIGQYDEEFRTLKQELEKLDEELEDRLRHMLTEELENFAENSEEAWKTAEAQIRQVLNTYKVDVKYCKDILAKTQAAAVRMREHTEFMKEQRKFMETHGETLAMLSAEQNEKNDLRIKLTTDTQARCYYHTLVKSLSHLYFAASVASTGYLDPKIVRRKKIKFARNILRVAGKTPGFGGAFDVAADGLDAIASRYEKKDLEAFANLGEKDGEDVLDIIQTVAQQLVLTYPGKFSQTLAKQHVEIIRKAVFGRKLNELENKGVTVAEGLLNLVEGKNINTVRAKATSNPHDPPRTPKDKSAQEELMQKLARIRKANNDDEEETGEALKPEEELLDFIKMYEPALQLLAQLSPEDQKNLLSQLNAQRWRLGITAAKQKEQHGDLMQELQKKFVTPDNGTTRNNIPGSTQKQDFRKPKDAIERNLQNTINARLSDIYDDLFEEVKISKDNKRTLKDRLRAAVLDKVLGDRNKKDHTFETVFLHADINEVFKQLKTILQKLIPSTPFKVDDAFAKNVVEQLARQLAPHPKQALRQTSMLL